MRELGKKEQLIVYVLHVLECIYGRTFFQKLFFLMEKELFQEQKFCFIKYYYGPFSRELNDAVNKLVEENIIEETKVITRGMHVGHCFQLPQSVSDNINKVTSGLSATETRKIRAFCEIYAHYSPSELLRHVYLKYPEWTENSVLN